MSLKSNREARKVRRIIFAAMRNWSKLKADANRAYYTPSDHAVFFDFTPMQYVGWQTYSSEIKKVQDSIRRFQITLHDDLAVRVLGRMAYAHGTWNMDFRFTDGSRRHLEGRLTEVLKKQKGKWRIVHEHASVPTLN